MERLVEFFSVFGGSTVAIDIDAPIEHEIVSHILEDYGTFYNAMSELIVHDTTYAGLLRAIAKGDRRTHSAFRRARLGEQKGNDALAFLIELHLLERETSRETPLTKYAAHQKRPKAIARHKISDKLRITLPFVRFWFYFISPHHHSIINGDYEPFLEAFTTHQSSFCSYIYEQLNLYLLYQTFQDDPIIDAKSYWDRQVEIDILALTQKMKSIVGECKWTNHKMNKKEWGKLKEKCALIGLRPEYTALFSKRGFSNELRSMQSSTLLLFEAHDLESLVHPLTYNA